MGSDNASIRWLPACVPAATALVLYLAFDVRLGQIALYLGWLLLAVVVPGTLIWRALRGDARSFVEDVASGSALGVAMEILIYIALRWIGVPRLIIVWPILVVATFLAVPKLRRHWRSGAPANLPRGWTWTVAILVAMALLYLGHGMFRTHPLTGPVSAFPYVDVPYHLALAGEVKHHMPPTVPYVLGEPLHHHWFAHAEMAASSWGTGLELRLIMLRLQMFPMIAIGMVLTALLASRVARRGWAGPLALVIGYFLWGLSPYLWAPGGVFGEQRLLDHFQWLSPSHLVSAVVFAPVPLLMIDLLRRERRGAGPWVLLAILLTASMGAKSTLIPLFVAGAVAAGVIGLLMRRLQPAALLGATIGLLMLVFSVVVLYGRDSYGIEWKPLGAFRRFAVVSETRLSPEGPDALPPGVVMPIVFLIAGAWSARIAGLAGFFRRSDDRRDPALWFLGGITAAALGVQVLFIHPGSSQLYFMRNALGVAAALAAAGIARAIPAHRRSRDGAVTVTVAMIAGAAGAWIVSLGSRSKPVAGTIESNAAVLTSLIKPMLSVAAFVLAAAVVLALVRRRVPWMKGLSVAITLALVTGTGLPNTVRETSAFATSLANGTQAELIPTYAPPIPPGALTAARWLRDHSSPDDVVATNRHCRYRSPFGCETRHFWISAYTERRVLVEGWGYTSDAMKHGKDFFYSPFPDPDLLAINDRAFTNPTRESLSALRDRFNVRWLFVDQRYDLPSPYLGRFVPLRFRSGDCLVYEIPAGF